MWTGFEDNVVTSGPQSIKDKSRSLAEIRSSLMMMMVMMMVMVMMIVITYSSAPYMVYTCPVMHSLEESYKPSYMLSWLSCPPYRLGPISPPLPAETSSGPFSLTSGSSTSAVFSTYPRENCSPTFSRPKPQALQMVLQTIEPEPEVDEPPP
jgi:hypothetical protein